MASGSSPRFAQTHVIATKYWRLAVAAYAVFGGGIFALGLISITLGQHQAGVAYLMAASMIAYLLIFFIFILFAEEAVGATFGQMSLARKLVSIEGRLARTEVGEDFSDAEPEIASRLAKARLSLAPRLDVLFEAAEGLDGANYSKLGHAMVERIAGDADRLSADIEEFSAAADDCSRFGLLLNDRSRDIARSVILAKIPA